MISARAAACYDALDAEDVARSDTRHAFICGYTTGWLARPDATGTDGAASELELVVEGGYTAAQQARADATAAASRCFQASLSITEGEDDLLYVTQSVQEMARSFAHYIEHGDQPKVCAPVPCPPINEAFLDAALDVVRGDPDVGDRIDQALDAAKMAQPRTRPAQP